MRTFWLIVAAIATLLTLSGCSRTATWKEEVRLLDGRKITVTQKREFESTWIRGNTGVPREFWITLKLKETGNRETIWNEKLAPIVLNVADGKLFLVGVPLTNREYDLYGKPQPQYVAYVWDKRVWKRIAFDDIPKSIYDVNLLAAMEPDGGAELVTLAAKNKRMSNPALDPSLKRIDPSVEKAIEAAS